MRRHKTKHATGEELRALLERYGLRGNPASAMVADLLRVSQTSVQGYYSRGLRRNDLDLLAYRLAEAFSKNLRKPTNQEKLA
jgi:hypothetical protein